MVKHEVSIGHNNLVHDVFLWSSIINIMICFVRGIWLERKRWWLCWWPVCEPNFSEKDLHLNCYFGAFTSVEKLKQYLSIFAFYCCDPIYFWMLMACMWNWSIISCETDSFCLSVTSGGLQCEAEPYCHVKLIHFACVNAGGLQCETEHTSIWTVIHFIFPHCCPGTSGSMIPNEISSFLCMLSGGYLI